MEWQLVERPPADRLIANYFRGNGWWTPPSRSALTSDGEQVSDEIWESPFPETTD